MSSPHAPLLNPSLLAGDHANLAASARLVADLSLPWLHLDIMDGHFVPNLTFGPETLAALRRAGIKLFFDTHLMLAEPPAAIAALLPHVDLVLVMTVQPGFGGQPFRTDMLPKLRQIDAWRRDRQHDFRLEVDGGIDLNTAAQCRAAGADTLVAGTSFFRAPDRRAYAAAFARL